MHKIMVASFSRLHRVQGFSLVELCVVMTIMAISTSMLLSFATTRTDADKIRETERKMKVIEDAIALYAVQNHKLPCDADATLAVSSASFGVQNHNATAIWCNSPTGFTDGANGTDAGSVPTKTLQLPDDYAFDAWGRRFTYTIREECSANYNDYAGTYNGQNFSGYMCDGSVLIKDASGITRDPGAIFMLMSHGKNGFGAWPRNGGSRLAAPTDADELQNYNTVTNNSTYVQKPITGTYDDIVHYMSRDQIIQRGRAFRGKRGLLASPNINPICDMVLGELTPAPTSSNYFPVPASAQAIAVCGPSADANCSTYMLQLATTIYNLCF